MLFAEDAELGADNYNDYLLGLKMEAEISPVDAPHIPRVSQLINKTNQFNLTTRRYSESEVQRFSTQIDYVTRYVTLQDKFGDNGLISVFIGKIGSDQTLEIDTWLMSCRVLKRRVEELLFQELVKEAIRRDLHAIRGVYLPSAKNSMVSGLLSNLGFCLTGQDADGSTHWEFTLRDSTRTGAILEQNIPIRIKG